MMKKLKFIFATHGIPEVIVSDNGSGFTSIEFEEFISCNGIRHLTTAPYHPSIKKLRSIFATHRIPEVIVSDNGSGFKSSEFKGFISLNGIHYLTTAPYHSSSNCLAERAVQVLKEGLKKCTSGDFEIRLAQVLFHYRTTPRSITGTPAELLMG